MNRQISTIFCDDIRQEIAGKMSLIGVYGPQLFVPEFPALLPKLCVFVTTSTPYTKPFEKLEVHVFKDDQKLATATPALPKALPPIPEWVQRREPEQSTPMLTVNSIFMFSPFELAEPCVLRVRAETEGETLRGAGLRVEHKAL